MKQRYDIAIAGYGPVGQTAAILLGRLGWSVGVFERWPDLYPLPRAVHYDDEVARIFQRLGIAGALEEITEPATTYEWQNARGETLLALDRSAPGPCGWPSATMFSQPQLEQLLDRTAKQVVGVEVHQGWELTDASDEGEQVRVSLRAGDGEMREVQCAYLLGCDGANSRVRELMGTDSTDLGFVFDWLIADTIPHDPALLAGVNLQRCDPARPTTLVSGGPGRRRWEWMLLPGETAEQAQTPEFAWELLQRSGVGPQDVALERYCVYTFRARWAERWRVGRMLLAGDAAHLMPPFAGQGMCSGIRDAFTLAWQLDMVLAGRAGEDTLEAYASERRGHLRSAIEISVELGKVICISDEEQAAARDEAMLAAASAPGAAAVELPSPSLGPGLHDDSAGAGTLFPQALAEHEGRPLRLDDALGHGFALYAFGADPREMIAPAERTWLEELGGSFVQLDAGLDGEGRCREWFERNGCEVALVRPDFYVFGTCAVAQATALVQGLRTALDANPTKKERIRA